MKISSYKDLTVWQKSIELVVEIYKVTELFPLEERYGLTSQTRRAAASIPANIVEGRFRSSRKDFKNFLQNAYASGAELETHIVIAKKLAKTKDIDYSSVDILLDEVMKMLNVLVRKMSRPEENTHSAN